MDRRTFLVLGTGVFLVPFGLRPRRRLLRRRIPIMGTIAEFAVLGDHAAIDAAVRELRFVDTAMSRFRPDSDVGRINREGSARVHRRTAAVLAEALFWAEATDGAFDPCFGRAVALWDVKRRREPPPADAVRRLAGRRLFRALAVEGDRVRVRDRDVAVDLGGIAKGYAVDRAVAALRAHGVRDGLVNVGGDLFALGVSDDGDAWRIGVRSPVDPSRCDRTIEVRDGAVATSGDYEQYFEHGGRRYHHLIDPDTGAPLRAPRHSLTVAAPSCMTADAAATALFGMDQKSARAVLRSRAPAASLSSS